MIYIGGCHIIKRKSCFSYFLLCSFYFLFHCFFCFCKIATSIILMFFSLKLCQISFFSYNLEIIFTILSTSAHESFGNIPRVV